LTGADSCIDAAKQVWNEAELVCLVLDVQGLKLAVPVAFLGIVKAVEIDDLIPPLNAEHGVMGEVGILGQTFIAVDTADIVMPGKANPAARKQYRHLVALRYVPWALVVSHVIGAVRLAKEDVHWRSGQTQRPWLAGTMTSQMTAILDPFAFVGCIGGGQ
jgi:purine-binding chemotaxis protein CheW